MTPWFAAASPASSSSSASSSVSSSSSASSSASASASASASSSSDASTFSWTRVTLADGASFGARVVVLCSGAAGASLLAHEGSAPGVAAQTAYGIEAEVEGYEGMYDASRMVFMDYRRHHTGVWEGTAPKIEADAFINGGNNDWGTQDEIPSFLYTMPEGRNRVFLEETCLVARPPLPFAVLKRRLERWVHSKRMGWLLGLGLTLSD